MIIFRYVFWGFVVVIGVMIVLTAPKDLMPIIIPRSAPWIGVAIYAAAATAIYCLILRFMSLATGGRNKEIEKEIEKEEGYIDLHLNDHPEREEE